MTLAVFFHLYRSNSRGTWGVLFYIEVVITTKWGTFNDLETREIAVAGHLRNVLYNEVYHHCLVQWGMLFWGTIHYYNNHFMRSFYYFMRLFQYLSSGLYEVIYHYYEVIFAHFSDFEVIFTYFWGYFVKNRGYIFKCYETREIAVGRSLFVMTKVSIL